MPANRISFGSVYWEIVISSTHTTNRRLKDDAAAAHFPYLYEAYMITPATIVLSFSQILEYAAR